MLQGHTSLPAPASLLVAVLVKATPDARGVSTGAGPRPLHLGPCLGTSGSMNDQAGLYGGRRMNKLDALKAAVQRALPLRESWGASGGRTYIPPSLAGLVGMGLVLGATVVPQGVAQEPE